MNYLQVSRVLFLTARDPVRAIGFLFVFAVLNSGNIIRLELTAKDINLEETILHFSAALLAVVTWFMFLFGDGFLQKILNFLKRKNRPKQVRSFTQARELLDLCGIIGVKFFLCLALYTSVYSLPAFEIAFGAMLFWDVCWLLGVRAWHFRKCSGELNRGPGLQATNTVGTASFRWGVINLATLIAGLFLAANRSHLGVSEKTFHGLLIALGFLRALADFSWCHGEYLKMRILRNQIDKES